MICLLPALKRSFKGTWWECLTNREATENFVLSVVSLLFFLLIIDQLLIASEKHKILLVGRLRKREAERREMDEGPTEELIGESRLSCLVWLFVSCCWVCLALKTPVGIGWRTDKRKHSLYTIQMQLWVGGGGCGRCCTFNEEYVRFDALTNRRLLNLVGRIL